MSDATPGDLCKRLRELADDNWLVCYGQFLIERERGYAFVEALRIAATRIEAQEGEIARLTAELQKQRNAWQLYGGDLCSANNETDLMRDHWHDAEDRATAAEARVAQAEALLREAGVSLRSETGYYDVHRDEAACVFCHAKTSLGRGADCPPIPHGPNCIIARIDAYLKETPDAG